jgi:hypothetical protein
MLQIDTNQILHLFIEEVIGQRIAVLGISGSGKTNTGAVLVEELLPHLPVTIVDVEGEWYGLKERYELLVAGRSEHAEVPLMLENAAALAEISIRRGISIILDLSEYDQDEMQEILLAYFQRLWQLATSQKTPYEVVIEEAHEFVPQGTRSPLKTLLTRFALRGRKRGVGVILSSQRSAKVEKDLLTQAGILFLHHVVHPTDLSVYKDLIPLGGRDVERQARELVPGEAFVVRGKAADRIHVRRRHTFHAGATPELGESQLHLKAIDTTLLEELREMTKRSVKEGGRDELSQLRKRLKDAEARIAELETAVKRKDEQIELLGKLRVVNSDTPTIPSTLSISQATVHHMHIPGGAIHTAPPARQIVESTVATETIELPAPLNEAKFGSLQTRLRQLPPIERDILRVLVEQSKSLTAQEIAAWLNKSESHIRNNPPRDLLKFGIVARSMNGKRGYLYRTTLAEYLKREFPGADVDVLQTRLIR